jgi:hypothetical protein
MTVFLIDIKSFVKITEDLVNDNLSQMFIEYESISKKLKNAVLNNTNKKDDTDLQSKIEKDVNSFLIIQLLKMNVNSNNSYIIDFLNFNRLNPLSGEENFLDKFFENKSKKGYDLLKHIIGIKGKVNTLKNSETLDSLRLASLSKLNPAQQDNIRNLFLEMYTSSNEKEKQFAKDLFAYFILKDGLQFRQYNISKIFPTIMFGEISKVLDNFKQLKKLSEKEESVMTTKFKSLWFSDIKNKKHRLKIKDSPDTEILKVYRFQNNIKVELDSNLLQINQPPLYLEINKNGEKRDYTKIGVDTKDTGNGLKLTLPQYIDYRGASYKRYYTKNTINLKFNNNGVIKEFPYNVQEEENPLDENLRVFKISSSKKEFKLVINGVNNAVNVNAYQAELFENEEKVDNVTVKLEDLQNLDKFNIKNQPYTYIREPYYGSTITDLTIDAGLIPATTEVNSKKDTTKSEEENRSKLEDLINQLEQEGTKTGYIQFYKNLLLNRYSPNFDKSLGENSMDQEIKNIEIKGINIRSDKTTPNSLANRLTNPNWYAKDLYDVETTYKANASIIKAPQLNAEEALKYDMNLMYQLQLKKFRQNPELIDEINAEGGLEFIKQSSHVVGVKNNRWEGKGLESNFIKVLAKSYETVSKELGKFKEEFIFNSLPSKSSTPTMTYAGIGSRETPQEVLDKMTEVARYLDGLGFTLNTGKKSDIKEEGADKAFSNGTNKKNLFPPSMANDLTRKIADEIHPDLKGMYDAVYNKWVEKVGEKKAKQYAQGAIDLQARNTYQVFGKNLDTPVDFVLFYAEETNNPLRPKGGTGQAVEMARRKGIPTINMSLLNWREELKKVLENTDTNQAQPASVVEDIYSKLGNKTQSENVVIVKWDLLKDSKKAIAAEAIISTRIKNSNEHFGNPFSSDERVLKQNSTLIKTNSTKESVEKYIDWVINSNESRAKWIREQLNSGELKDEQILYYTELNEPSHATALDYLINKYDWSKPASVDDTSNVQGTQSEVVSDISQEQIHILGNKQDQEMFFNFVNNISKTNQEERLPIDPSNYNINIACI